MKYATTFEKRHLPPNVINLPLGCYWEETLSEISPKSP